MLEMPSDDSLLKFIDIGRLFVSAVGFWASFSTWVVLRRLHSMPLVVALRRMFAAVAIVLFVASGANLFRVAYGTETFLANPLLQLVVVMLYAAMTGTAVKFYWQLIRG